MEMPKRIVNGWYEYQPFYDCSVYCLDENQIVQVIEGMVWVTGVGGEVSVKEAKENGSFIKRIKLSE